MAIQDSSAIRSSVPDPGFGRVAPFRRGASTTEAESGRRQTIAPESLSPAERRQLNELQQIDRRVRAHELAHISAGAGVVQGGASFTYTKGPDGRVYAVGGEVPIDMSPARTLAETIDKARAIQRAALAPVDPSAQDRRIAAQAVRMAAEASAELAARGGRQGTSGAGAERAAGLYAAVQGSDEVAAGDGFFAVA